MKINIKSYRTLGIALTTLFLGCGEALGVIYSNSIDFESPEGSGYSLAGDANGTAIRSTAQFEGGSHSAQFSLNNTQADFAKVIIDVAPGALKLKDAYGTFSAYIETGNPAYLPYMYFGVDTDGNGTFSFGTDSFVIAHITDGPAVLYDTWQTSGIDGSTDVHVVGARTGLGTAYVSASTVDTLSSLTSFSTGTGLWGDLDILEVRVGAGETGSDYGAYSVFIDNISVAAVPEPTTTALLIGGSVLGLLYFHRRRKFLNK